MEGLEYQDEEGNHWQFLSERYNENDLFKPQMDQVERQMGHEAGLLSNVSIKKYELIGF